MTISLIAFSESKPAYLIVAYLNSQQIEAKVVFADNVNASQSSEYVSNDTIHQNEAAQTKAVGYQVTIDDQADIATATQIIDDFLKQPNQAKFQDSAWEQGVISTRNSYADGGPSGWVKSLYEFKQTPFTFLVLLGCCLVFVLSFLGYFPVVGRILEIRSLPELMQTHEWWRLIGPNFIHFSFMHIAFNLVWWWMLGRQLELSFGSSALIFFFVIASLFSNIAQLVVSGPNFGGLSGIVYALVGFVWWIGWLRPAWLISLPKNIIYFLLAWLALGYFDLLWVNMANEAHTFGLISGCLMALIIHVGSPKQPKA